MTAFKSQAELERLLTELWNRIFAAPEIVAAVSGVPLIAKFRYTDYPTALYIDTKSDPPGFYWNPDPPVEADVEMILSSETAHHFWMETLNVPLAIAGRKIIPKGSVQKALKLIPALKPAFALYPDVLRDAGREDLLAVAKKKKRRRSSGPAAFWPLGSRSIPATISAVSVAGKAGSRLSSNVRARPLLKKLNDLRLFFFFATASRSSRPASLRTSG